MRWPGGAGGRPGWLGSRAVINDGDVPRELSVLVVPAVGAVEAGSDLWAPVRLIDSDGDGRRGDGVPAGAAGLGPSAATQRSYGMDLLRWFRFRWAIEVSWDQATRVEARDFCRWLRLRASRPELAFRRRCGNG